MSTLPWLLAACAASNRAEIAPSQASSAGSVALGSTPQATSRGIVQTPMQVFQHGFDGDGVALRNGGLVVLAESLSTEVFVDPFPATGPTSWLDLYLDAHGQPVDNAEVTSDNEMAYMNHGSTREAATNSGEGHYLFALNYPMLGPWRHHIDIRLAQQHYELPLVITVFP